MSDISKNFLEKSKIYSHPAAGEEKGGGGYKSIVDVTFTLPECEAKQINHKTTCKLPEPLDWYVLIIINNKRLLSCLSLQITIDHSPPYL